ncbi:hypothetical protein HGRIS_002043 [Hohenbuehelia grisea]|uniref:Tyrosinase copper-binding domain-containing protein n=1 Tax=Hohenbuehelia grisea TaxID=104357 RepID=A0ABR3JL23_9AGAR
MICASLSRILLLVTLPLLAQAVTNPNNVGKCEKMTLRREWRTLSRAERADWINAIKCLANIRHERLSLSLHGEYISPDKVRPSLYDDFAYAHATAERAAHITPYFLPWHRWFVLPAPHFSA